MPNGKFSTLKLETHHNFTRVYTKLNACLNGVLLTGWKKGKKDCILGRGLAR
jgi:hypothetical protein